ncbi:MAG TPA: hypothetical protein VGA45_21455, partial [Actinomycetota bacterium]
VALTPALANAAEDGPIPDSELTQPMRIPTGTLSAAEKAQKAAADKAAQQVRQRGADSTEEITAVIDMSGMVKDGAADGDKK